LEIKEMENKNNNETKYQKYQLPGGENYREKLLTLPINKGPAYEAWENKINELNSKYGEGFFNKNKMTPQEKSDLLLLHSRAGNGAGDPALNYKSSHWDEPNVIAHIRMNDRNVEGKDALHIEEIQSDLHQQGREKGYKLSTEDEEKLNPEFLKIDDKIVASGDEEIMGNPDINKAVKMAVDRKIITPDEAKTYLRVADSQKMGAVPDAPFKKTWLDLALKRVIREAAESGKDRISWTPGEAQAARYDLSKQVD